MPIKDNAVYELALVIRLDDLESLPAMLQEIKKRVSKITADKLDEVGGEESGAATYCAGWYDFNLRDREQVADDAEPTKMPVRFNVDEPNAA